MTDERVDAPSIARIQRLFDQARELPPPERSGWLRQQCSRDQALRLRVERLLANAERSHDPLEAGVEAAIGPSVDLDLAVAAAADPTLTGGEIDLDGFIDRLSAADLLPPEELQRLREQAVDSGGDSDAEAVVSDLVDSGKLTHFQASALIRGEPELLVDKYLILDLIDAGGMGIVFKAIHRPMNRMVAIKMVSPRLLASDDQVRRFQREVRVAASLEHENIVRAYDADHSNGMHFLVMEYVRGDNLALLVSRNGPMTAQQAVDCVRQAAEGLRYANHRGVIHRDIKPGNLMLTGEGLLKVLDLGLASIDQSLRLTQPSAIAESETLPGSHRPHSELTRPGTLLGTVSYMAPEQSLDAERADTRSDIYSLGCTLYYLLAGEAPYRGDSVKDVVVQHRDVPVPLIRDVRPDVPETLASVAKKMLAKSPEQRFQSMGELISAIDECALDLPKRDLTRRTKRRPRARPAAGADAAETINSASDQRRPSTGVAIGLAALVIACASLTFLVNTGPATSTSADLATPDKVSQPKISLPSRVASLGVADLHTQSPTVAERFASGDWTWSQPRNPGPPINSPNMDLSPTLNGDQSTIIFWSRRDARKDDNCLWTADRQSRMDDWSEPIPLQGILSAANPRLSSDGRTLLCTQARRGKNLDLFVTTRLGRDQPFAPLRSLGSNVNSSSRTEAAASLSGDGLVLVHSSQPVDGRDFWAPETGIQIFMRTRASTEQAFGPPETLSFVDQSGNRVRFGQMFLTPDALNLYGVISYPDSRKPDLGVSSRRSRKHSFGPIIPLPSVNTDYKERTPWVSEDGTTLWFTSDRLGGQGSVDIWVSELIRN